MVSPIDDPFSSPDHLPIDVSIAYFTLLPKGVFDIVLTTIIPTHYLKNIYKKEVTRERAVQPLHLPL